MEEGGKGYLAAGSGRDRYEERTQLALMPEGAVWEVQGRQTSLGFDQLRVILIPEWQRWTEDEEAVPLLRGSC
jgi:hypothetical protein